MGSNVSVPNLDLTEHPERKNAQSKMLVEQLETISLLVDVFGKRQNMMTMISDELARNSKQASNLTLEPN